MKLQEFCFIINIANYIIFCNYDSAIIYESFLYMIRKNELTLSQLQFINDAQFLIIGNSFLLLGHVIYLVIFQMTGITIMTRYNYFSVLFYIVMIFFIHHFKNINLFTILIMLEIILHSTLATLCLGWTSGFGQFMLCIIPIPFFISMKKKLSPFLFSLLDIIIFISLKVYTAINDPLYSNAIKDYYELGLYITNSLFSFFVIVYMSSSYIISRNVAQYNLRIRNEELQKLSAIDPLTKLFNRRAMSEYLKHIQKISDETNKNFIIGLCDIDDFKRINDTYGHDAGDEALVRISRIIVNFVPTEGYVCRWGGEEILYVIPAINLETAVEISEKIRKKIHDAEFSFGGTTFKASMTFGLCESAKNLNYEKCITIADERLYYGKNHGKNQVIYETPA